MVRLYQSGKVTFIQIEKILGTFRLGGVSSDQKWASREGALIKYYYNIISLKEMLAELFKSI